MNLLLNSQCSLIQVRFFCLLCQHEFRENQNFKTRRLFPCPPSNGHQCTRRRIKVVLEESIDDELDIQQIIVPQVPSSKGQICGVARA